MTFGLAEFALPIPELGTADGDIQNEIKCGGLAVALDREVSVIFSDRVCDQ
jgi:hypothetical protein